MLVVKMIVVGSHVKEEIKVHAFQLLVVDRT